MNDMGGGLFLAHAGAGYHSQSKERSYVQALNEALKAPAAQNSPLKAAATIIRSLEASPCTNAGGTAGSSRTWTGGVEVDASIMDGEDGAFGAVGAAPGLAHPIDVACQVLRDSRKPLSNGRVRPMLLVGDGARSYALTLGLVSTSTTYPRSQEAVELWERYRSLVERGDDDQAIDASKMDEWHRTTNADPNDQKPGSKRRRVDRESGEGVEEADEEEEGEEEKQSLLYDTVGAISVDDMGRVAAGVSSGGLMLKHEGRVGEAAVLGAGCWARSPSMDHSGCGVGISISGVGEVVMRAVLAKTCGEELMARGEEACVDVLIDLIRRVKDGRCWPPGCRAEPSDVGVLAVRVDRVKVQGQEGRWRVQCEVAAVFSSPSFAIGSRELRGGKAPVSMVLRNIGNADGICSWSQGCSW